jgi:hypothetical protein
VKKLAMAAYTVFCLALGGLLFHGITQAGGYVNNQFFTMQEYGCPSGYRACGGVSFKGGVTRSDVIIDWKSDHNFAIFVK